MSALTLMMLYMKMLWEVTTMGGDCETDITYDARDNNHVCLCVCIGGGCAVADNPLL